VALAHIVVLSAALLTLLALPCAVAAFARADSRALRGSRRARQGRAHTRQLHVLDRALAEIDEFPALIFADGPPIEQIAFDLRRLDRQRRSGPTCESERWLEAVQSAYDERLKLACRRLGLAEHLEGLEGLDCDLERLRVESALQAAGLALRAA
jgi:hypothetical protein